MIRGKHGRLVMFLSDVLLISACCLFVISMGTPFLKNNQFYACAHLDSEIHPMPPNCKPYPSYYWSFQAFHTSSNRITMYGSYWFDTFDSGPYPPRLSAPIFLITMFMNQILTVASGLLSLFVRERWIRLVPLASSAFVALLMIITNSVLFGYYRLGYEIGYWLTYPPMLLFLLAFTMNLIAGKTRTTDGKELGQLDTAKTNTLFLCS